jgi:hypothetical protein
MRSSAKDQVHAVLAKLGIPVPCSDLFGAYGQTWLDGLKPPQPYGGKVTSLRHFIAWLTAEVGMLDVELFESVEYGNGSDEAFLVWFRHELCGDEPFEASVLTRLKALPEPFAERLHWPVGSNVYKAASAGEWDKAVEMLLAGLAEGNALVSPAEYEELTKLRDAVKA